MAKQYRLGVARRFVNAIISRRIRAGKSVGAGIRLITTIGRKSGLKRTNPVTIVEVDGAEWLVAPYGAVSWVRNLRVTGTATLRRGTETLGITAIEVGPSEAAPVLKHYITEVEVVRPFFDVRHDDSVEAFVGFAQDKPVFRIEPRPGR